jgi:hypothetical protein
MDIKAVASFFTQNSRGLAEGDLLPKIISGQGAALVGGSMLTIGAVNNGIKARNNAKLGKVVYNGGPDRMTQSYTTGAVNTIRRIAGNDPEAFSELTKSAMDGGDLNLVQKLEDYGVNDKFVSAFYGMR